MIFHQEKQHAYPTVFARLFALGTNLRLVVLTRISKNLSAAFPLAVNDALGARFCKVLF
jgi:hypothetical protein